MVYVVIKITTVFNSKNTELKVFEHCIIAIPHKEITKLMSVFAYLKRNLLGGGTVTIQPQNETEYS